MANGFTNINAQILASMDLESKVNGVWARIVSTYLPFPNYIIAPEFAILAGRNDLGMVRVGGAAPGSNELVLVVEGKNQGTQCTAPAVKNQMYGYLEDRAVAWSNDIGRDEGLKFGIIACGTQFGIVAYDGTSDNLLAVDLAGGIITSAHDFAGAHVKSLGTAADRTWAHNVLTAIAALGWQ